VNPMCVRSIRKPGSNEPLHRKQPPFVICTAYAQAIAQGREGPTRGYMRNACA
jgi:hypothetical protein